MIQEETSHKKKLINIDGFSVEVDENCVEAVEFFNSIGLKTQFCCEGGGNNCEPRFHILFHENVKDKDIKAMMKRVSALPDPNGNMLDTFIKWGRLGYGDNDTAEPWFNWEFSFWYKDEEVKAELLQRLRESIENYKNFYKIQ